MHVAAIWNGEHIEDKEEKDDSKSHLRLRRGKLWIAMWSLGWHTVQTTVFRILDSKNGEFRIRINMTHFEIEWMTVKDNLK